LRNKKIIFSEKLFISAFDGVILTIVMNKKSLWKLVPTAVVTLSLTSCLEVAETITLKKDGSGTIVEETILGAQMSAMMTQLSALGGGAEGKNEMFSEESAKKRAAAIGTGVTVEKVEKIDKDGRTGGRTTFHFNDINTVTLSLSDGASALTDSMPQAGEAEKAAEKAEPMKFSFKDNVLTITTPQPKKPEGAAKEDTPAGESPALPEGADGAQAQAMAMTMMKDMKMSMKLVIEPGIAESDASYVEGNTVTLTEMDFGKLMADPEMAKKLTTLDPKDAAAMEEKLKGIKGIKAETKEKITIKLK
jgi:hypothetical protein